MATRSFPLPLESPAVPVLVITPFKSDHATLNDMLPATRWTVHSTTSLASASAQLKKMKQLPLVMCDSDLARGSWREMLGKVLAMSHPPRMIVTSQFADEQLWAEALSLGAYDVLAKPYRVEEVERTLSSALDNWRSAARKRGARARTPRGAVLELLVIEEGAADAARIRELFSQAGIEGQATALSADEAVQRLGDATGSQFLPNLILFDCGLDHPATRAALREIGANPRLAGIPSVVLWSAGEQCPDDASALGASCLIAKPCELRHFVGLCESAVRVGGRSQLTRVAAAM